MKRAAAMEMDDLRSELERRVKALSTGDQARVLALIEAMLTGTEIDSLAVGKLAPAQLRDWTDSIGRRKN